MDEQKTTPKPNISPILYNNPLQACFNIAEPYLQAWYSTAGVMDVRTGGAVWKKTMQICFPKKFHSADMEILNPTLFVYSLQNPRGYTNTLLKTTHYLISSWTHSGFAHNRNLVKDNRASRHPKTKATESSWLGRKTLQGLESAHFAYLAACGCSDPPIPKLINSRSCRFSVFDKWSWLVNFC